MTVVFNQTGIPSTVLSPSTTEGVSSQTSSSSSSSSSTAGTVTSSVTASHPTSTGRASPTTVPHDQLGLGIPLFLCLNIVIIILMAIMS